MTEYIFKISADDVGVDLEAPEISLYKRKLYKETIINERENT